MGRGGIISMSNTTGGADYEYIYRGSDPQSIIAEIVIDYFNDLGNLILKVRSEGRYLKPEECNHLNVRAMLKTGLFVEKLSSNFIGGPSSKVSIKLFGITSMVYHQYFLDIYHEMRHAFEKPPIFTPGS